jgi:phospholipid/cholesterol/gamma-HCH transport system permease protein
MQEYRVNLSKRLLNLYCGKRQDLGAVRWQKLLRFCSRAKVFADFCAEPGYGVTLRLTKSFHMSDYAASITHKLQPACRAVAEAGGVRILVSGDWTLAALTEVQDVLAALEEDRGDSRFSKIDLAELQMLDTAGALSLIGLRNRAGGAAADFVNESPAHRILLDEVARAAQFTAKAPPSRRPFAETTEALALALTAIARDAVRLTAFLGETAAALGRVVARPARFRGTSFVHQIQQTGLTAVPIVALVCFLIGGVIIQQSARQLRTFGAENISIDMLGILALREVGVLLAAVMVAGRSASAFTAQIGTMKMREEIDAMRTLGIDPMETLVIPRILALIVALPLLVFVADMMCLAGGALMAKMYMSIDLPIYLQRLNSAVSIKHLYVGLIKAPFAALVIGLVGCLEGMSVKGSAESLGAQVTAAVVKAIFLVLVLDAVFAIFLAASGF